MRFIPFSFFSFLLIFALDGLLINDRIDVVSERYKYVIETVAGNHQIVKKERIYTHNTRTQIRNSQIRTSKTQRQLMYRNLESLIHSICGILRDINIIQ